MILEVWGDHWISPGRSECCYFIDFGWYSEMSCFLRIFHRNLEVMLFSTKINKYMVLTLILGGLNVAISCVLSMFLESHVFRRCALERPWGVLGRLLGWFWRSGVLLGSVLGGQNVVISVVLDCFCDVMFFNVFS